MTNQGEPCNRRALPRSRYCWQHQSFTFKVLSGATLTAGLTVLAFFSDLHELGVRWWSILNKDSSPVRVVSVALAESRDGHPTLDITVRKVTDEPVVLSEARVVVDDVLRLRPCGEVPLSSLAPTGVYDVALPLAKGTVTTSMAQLVSPKTADRFQLVLAPAEADALYRVSVSLLYNESHSTLDLGHVVVFIDDHLVLDVPAPDVPHAHEQDDCISSNIITARGFFQAAGTSRRTDRAAGLERRVRASYANAVRRRSGIAAPGASPLPAEPVPEETVPEAVLETDRNSVLLFVGKPSEKNGPICQGGIFGEQLVLTAAHCLIDRRTGRRRDPDEITVLRVADGTEHGVRAFQLDYPREHLAALQVAPPFRR